MAIGFLNRLFIQDKDFYNLIFTTIHIRPNKISLYKLALRHKSAASEIKQGVKNSNERLEFLGDAVLGMIIGKMLFKKFPYKDEGFLTEVRSKLVNRAHLGELAKRMGISALIEHDSRSINMREKNGSSMHGDAFEALVGAIYLDKGYKFTSKYILEHVLKEYVDIEMLIATESNYKSRLLEYCQKFDKKLEFETEINETKRGKRFTTWVIIDETAYDKADDFSKKISEKMAAEIAFKKVIYRFQSLLAVYYL